MNERNQARNDEANNSIESLTDEDLWASAIRESEIERNSTLKVIALLQEINLRRLHLKRGYSSLHEYCVNVLKYSDGGAYRRIKAMRLVEELPETKKSIESGSLNLTTASQIQKVIETKRKSQKPLSKTEKLELFNALDGKSKIEVDKTIATICPEVILRPERQRYISQDQVQKTLVISEALNEKIEKLKKLKAHENKDFAIILEELVDRELKRIDPLSKSISGQKVQTKIEARAVQKTKVHQVAHVKQKAQAAREAHLDQSSSGQRIPAPWKQTITGPSNLLSHRNEPASPEGVWKVS